MPPTFKGNYFMIKELMLLGALLSPNMAYVPVPAYTLVNATNSRVIFYASDPDEEQIIPAKTITNYNWQINTSKDIAFSIYKSDYPTKPTDFYYLLDAPDSEPVDVVFWEGSNTWNYNIDAYKPARGIQIGRYESLAGVHAYLNTNKLGITGVSSSVPDDTLYDLISGYGITSFQYVLESGNLSSAFSNMVIYKNTSLIQGAVPYVTLNSTFYNSSTPLLIAKNRIAGDTTNQPTLYFTNSFTNEVVFNNGLKVIRFGELNGSLPYYFVNEDTGYLSENVGAGNLGIETLTTGFELGGLALSLLGSAFGWVIFPGVSIGLLLLFPLIISLFVWLIRFLKKG